MKLHKHFAILTIFSIALLAASVLLLLMIDFRNVAARSDDKISDKKREEAYRANNIGVAKLEQYAHKEAVVKFQHALKLYPKMKIAQINLAIAHLNAQENIKALNAAKKAAEIAPELPQVSYVLGLIAKSEGRVEDSLKSFQKVLEMDKFDVGTNVNLGQIYIQKREYVKAEAFLRRALESEPYNSTALYNLATTLIRTKSREEGKKFMLRFQDLRKSGAATSIGQKYLEQGRYAEAIASTGAEDELVDKTMPKVTFETASIGIKNKSKTSTRSVGYIGETFQIKPRSKYQILKSIEGGETLIDFDNDGDLDLARIDNTLTNYKKLTRDKSTAKTSARISLYKNDKGKFTDISNSTGDLIKPIDSIGTSIISGDFDNDLLPDILLVGYKDLRLYKNIGNGKFEDVSANAKFPKYPYLSISSTFLDADHDGDLDIFIAGFTDISDGRSEANDFGYPQEFDGVPSLLLRNDGDGTFTDISEISKINQSKEGYGGKSVSVVPIDYDNRRDIDLLVLNYLDKPHLLRNLRDSSFQNVAGDVGIDISGKWSSLAVGDFNKDGFIDFFFGNVAGRGAGDAKGRLIVSDGSGKFKSIDAPKGTENASASQFLDYDNDGLLDLLVSTPKGLLIARNLGSRFAEATSNPFKQLKGFENVRKILSTDIDSDGDLDLIINGRFLRNNGGNINNSEIFKLEGRISNRTGIGAKIVMRSGSLTQKLETYSASPAPAPSDVHFGLGKREKPDAVRVIWTSGIVQAEIDFPNTPTDQTAKSISPTKIEELDRKPSSCPYIYTWNGKEFEFVTDFLGGGEMGNWKEEGVYYYPDSDEFVRITSDQLKPKDGKYEIRVTNELEEVLFLDQLKLIAVEHDANKEVYPNEGLGIPSAGKRILYTTQNEQAPITARDTEGNDIQPKINKLDRVFYDNFKSQNIRGYAEPHNLTLNLDDKKGFDGRTLLLLTGWTDYALSSDNLAASQSGRSLFLPKLQVKNKKGEWQTVIESIGISIGRPQTLVVDLTGKFLTDSREVRIVTNFKTYWDKIAVDTSKQTAVKKVELNPLQASLRERGFSEEVKYGEMLVANYDKVLNDDRWKYFSGNFTKTGAVNKLLNEVDDIFVISKTGDELVLNFKALSTPPKGKQYTFLLYVDGYSKEMDINSGSPDAIYPLPFKAMKAYPYNSEEQFPMSDEKRQTYDEYTTRTVKGFLPRLESYLVD